MVVYADLVFLLNACIDYLLLWLTAGIRKQRVKMWRLGIAAVIGGLYSVMYLFPYYSLVFSFGAKIFVSLVMVWVAFGFHHIFTYLRNLSFFYLVCFLVGGSMIALHYAITGNTYVAGGVLISETGGGWGSPVSWLFILVGFPLVWLYTKWSFRSLGEREDLTQFLTPIRIYIDDVVIECTGLIDTGNQLRDPVTRAPVMMMDLAELKQHIPKSLLQMVMEKDWEKGWNHLPAKWMQRIRIIPYRAAGNVGEMMISFKPNQVEIWKNHQWNNIGDVIIGIDVGHLSTDGTYQAIIHPSCVIKTA